MRCLGTESDFLINPDGPHLRQNAPYGTHCPEVWLNTGDPDDPRMNEQQQELYRKLIAVWDAWDWHSSLARFWATIPGKGSPDEGKSCLWLSIEFYVFDSDAPTFLPVMEAFAAKHGSIIWKLIDSTHHDRYKPREARADSDPWIEGPRHGEHYVQYGVDLNVFDLTPEEAVQRAKDLVAEVMADPILSGDYSLGEGKCNGSGVVSVC